jgi:hypothetical protein
MKNLFEAATVAEVKERMTHLRGRIIGRIVRPLALEATRQCV